VYLLLGDSQDSCCVRVRSELDARNYPSRLVSNPLVRPWRFAWQLNNEESFGQLRWMDESPILGHDIKGVLVRTSGWLDPSGWEPPDLGYVQAETLAAFVAWLWSLQCPVVNRYPTWVWYQPHNSLLSWHKLLRNCGLRIPETVVTNVEHEARAFGRRAEAEGIEGAIYGPVSGSVRYLINSAEDWTGLATLQRVNPVCLTAPH